MNKGRVIAILDKDPQRVRETAASGRRLLSVAAEFGHAGIAKLLLERGADPTWSDADARRGAAFVRSRAKR